METIVINGFKHEYIPLLKRERKRKHVKVWSFFGIFNKDSEFLQGSRNRYSSKGKAA